MRKMTFKNDETVVRFKALVDGVLKDIVEVREGKLAKREAFNIMNDFQFVKDTLEVEYVGNKFSIPEKVLVDLIDADLNKKFVSIPDNEKFCSIELPKLLYVKTVITDIMTEELVMIEDEFDGWEEKGWMEIDHINIPESVYENIVEKFEVK